MVKGFMYEFKTRFLIFILFFNKNEKNNKNINEDVLKIDFYINTRQQHHKLLSVD